MSIKGWLRRSSTLMAQAKDLARQLQEERDETRYYSDLCGDWATLHKEIMMEKDNLQTQLARLARERYEERERRLAAEDKLAEMYESERPENILARYLEALENEEE